MNPTFAYGEPDPNSPWFGQGSWVNDHAENVSTPEDAPGGFQSFWDNYMVDVIGALPGILYAINPDKYGSPPKQGGSSTVVVKESNNWLVWVLAAVVLIVIIVLIVKK